MIQILTAAKLISSQRGATIAELTDELGVSRRSAYRVLEALDELGYPYYKDEEHGNRYRLVEHDRPPAWWTPLPQASFNVEDREWPATYRLEDLADGALRMNFETQDLFELKRWILG